jgi:hypothetical protein
LSPLHDPPGVMRDGQEPTLLQAAIATATAIAAQRGRRIFMWRRSSVTV